MRALTTSCVFALVVAACSDDSHQTNTPVESPTPATTAAVHKDADSPTQITRPAARPASAKEWKSLQDYVSAEWTIAHKEGLAHEALMASMSKAYRHQDVDGVADAMELYRSTLNKLAEQSDKLIAPDIANEDTQRYLEAATGALAASDLVEMTKTAALLGGFNGTRKQPTDEEIERLTQEENMEMLKAVLAFQLVYQNYGYTLDDIDVSTYRIKPKAKPSAIATLVERFDTIKTASN
jgi:hypothetical protein